MNEPAARRGAWALAVIGLVGLVGLVWFGRGDPRGPDPVGPSRTKQTGDLAPELAPASEFTSEPWTPSASAGRIRGRISDPDAGPLSEGRIDVACQSAPGQAASSSSTTIDEDGQFVVTACSTGPSCLRLTHPSVEQPDPWVFEAGAEVELDVGPAPGRLGSIRGPDGEPVANAELVVQVEAEPPTFATSDAVGEFVITRPSLRPCDPCDDDELGRCRTELGPTTVSATVLISAPGYAPLERELELGQADPIEFTLAPPAAPITGRVVGDDGSAFDERTRVIAQNRVRAHERHAARVDSDGGFTFESLAEAEYSLRAIRDERELAVLELARPGEQVALRSEFGASGSTLTVQIVDAAGDPVAGARVDGGPFQAVISDTSGRVTASRVLPGRYSLRVRRVDCPMTREPIELEAPAQAWLRRIQLAENC